MTGLWQNPAYLIQPTLWHYDNGLYHIFAILAIPPKPDVIAYFNTSASLHRIQDDDLTQLYEKEKKIIRSFSPNSIMHINICAYKFPLRILTHAPHLPNCFIISFVRLSEWPKYFPSPATSFIREFISLFFLLERISPNSS